MKRIWIFLLLICLCGCAEKTEDNTEEEREEIREETVIQEETEMEMKLKIGEKEVSVQWENNPSVDALKEIVKEKELKVDMSMYGGFEQVGSLGQRLVRNDRQTVTQSGDIVLYSGDQVVVFYGSNSWAYTRLGHIADQSEEDMRDLLASGDTVLTFYMGGE